MKRTQQLTPGAALVIGLLFVACGVPPMLAAFDLGPLSAQDIDGPPWLGFAAAGLAIMAGPQAPLATRLFGTLARLLKAAEWLILASLAPILLPWIIILLLGSALGAIKTRLITGAWPRNEEFIARQKAKGLLGRFGNKPPADGGPNTA